MSQPASILVRMALFLPPLHHFQRSSTEHEGQVGLALEFEERLRGLAEREYHRWVIRSQVDKPPCRAAGDSIVSVDGADAPLTLSSRRKGSRPGFSG